MTRRWACHFFVGAQVLALGEDINRPIFIIRVFFRPVRGTRCIEYGSRIESGPSASKLATHREDRRKRNIAFLAVCTRCSF